MTGMLQVSGGEADWRCSQCGCYNRAGHRMCTSCEKWQDLDWDCVMCGFKNFAKRDTCKACNSGKAVAEEATGLGGGSFNMAQGAGDWAGGNPGAGTAGDWAGGNPGDGTAGGYQDPYSADNSFSQAVPFQSVAAPVEVGGGQELPWMCGLCKSENAPQKILCFECSGHRERVEVRNRAAENRVMQGGGGRDPRTNKPPVRALSNPRHISPMSDRTRVQYRPGGPIEDQSQDWNCGNCMNRNFAKRSKCNKCSKPRSEVEVKDVPQSSSWDEYPARGDDLNYRSVPRGGGGMMSSGSGMMSSGSGMMSSGSGMMSSGRSYQEPMGGGRPEDRSQDWKCSACENRNFAKRTECNKCSKPRSEVEDKDTSYNNDSVRMMPSRKRFAEPMMLQPKQIRYDSERQEDLSNDWVCVICNINCFAKKTHCFRCNRPREEVETKSTSAMQFEKPMVSYPMNAAPKVSGHNLQLGSGYGGTPNRYPKSEERPRKKWVDEDKTNDWNCQFCEINNFAKRTTCFRCKKDREECELKNDESVSQAKDDANDKDNDKDNE